MENIHRSLDQGRFDILTDARRGSADALGRMMEECQNYLLLVANRELGSDIRAKAGASDIVQDTFLDAQRDFPNFQGTTEAEFRAWLRRLLLNNMANCARKYTSTEKRSIRREIELNAQTEMFSQNLADSGPTPSRALVDAEERQDLLNGLSKLPNHYREVILLRHRDGLGYAEIGKRMNRTPEAVRKLWARGIELLQEILEGHEPSGRCSEIER
jgi:RNA polymerase sigma-70 factor (ECF subfamily)